MNVAEIAVDKKVRKMSQNKEDQSIMVSVFCLTYNHEEFIRKTLDGFVMQETTFAYEILIHDDASTDHTADIIREYETKYPEIIRPVYQVQNQKSQGIDIIQNQLLAMTKGKYLAWCEGDDYWTDPNKLKLQVEALEKNNSCVACISKVEKVTLDGKPMGSYIPACFFEDQIIEGSSFVRYALNPGGFPLQLSGFMIKRHVYVKYISEAEPYRKFFKAGDTPLALYLGLEGDVAYLNRVMSHYRTGNSSSFVGRTHNSAKNSADYLFSKAEAYEAFDAFTNYLFHEEARQAANNHRFSAYLKTHNVKEMKKGEMREYYNELSIKGKIYERLCCSCPDLEKLLSSLSRIKK